MNARVIVTVLLFLISSYGTKAQSTKEQKLPFECPVECKSSDYKPICSRGISYADLCILKQQICKGDTAPEIYNDVEPCPKYDKEDDANGASVEVIDKNGVVFRNFFHMTDNKQSRRSASKKISTNDRATLRRRGKKLTKCPRIDCSDREIGNHPVCIMGVEISNFCAVKRLVCQSHLPVLAIFLAKRC